MGGSSNVMGTENKLLDFEEFEHKRILEQYKTLIQFVGYLPTFEHLIYHIHDMSGFNAEFHVKRVPENLNELNLKDIPHIIWEKPVKEMAFCFSIGVTLTGTFGWDYKQFVKLLWKFEEAVILAYYDLEKRNHERGN